MVTFLAEGRTVIITGHAFDKLTLFSKIFGYSMNWLGQFLLETATLEDKQRIIERSSELSKGYWADISDSRRTKLLFRGAAQRKLDHWTVDTGIAAGIVMATLIISLSPMMVKNRLDAYFLKNIEQLEGMV